MRPLFPGLVEVDFDVFGGPASGDDVELSIAIEVREAKVFTRHAVIVDRRLSPVHALWEQFDAEEFDADARARFVHRPPADHDLVLALAEQIAASESVGVDQRIVEHMPAPMVLSRRLWLNIDDQVCSMHRLDRGKETA